MNEKIVTNQELLVSNMLEVQALIRIPTKKGITNEDEVLEEVKASQLEVNENVKKMGKEN